MCFDNAFNRNSRLTVRSIACMHLRECSSSFTQLSSSTAPSACELFLNSASAHQSEGADSESFSAVKLRAPTAIVSRPATKIFAHCTTRRIPIVYIAVCLHSAFTESLLMCLLVFFGAILACGTPKTAHMMRHRILEFLST